MKDRASQVGPRGVLFNKLSDYTISYTALSADRWNSAAPIGRETQGKESITSII